MLLKYHKFIVHVFIWMMFFTLHVTRFSPVQGAYPSVLRATLLLLLYLSVFYSNWFLFIPKLYIGHKYAAFSICLFSLLFAGTVLRLGIEQHFGFVSDYLKMQFRSAMPFRGFLLSFGLLSVLIILSSLFRITEYYNQKINDEKIWLQQRNEAELKLLRLQLNPHFLFNALNNIYALVLTQSEKAPDSLMSLSQLLRYIIYETATDSVPIEKEITGLKYYIELESLRLTQKEMLTVSITDELPSGNIIPLLFIPFVENSFKHSNINNGGFIHIELKSTGNQLHFLCENSIALTPKQVDGLGGIGLANTKKRLQLMYPDAHLLIIERTDSMFKVQLRLEL